MFNFALSLNKWREPEAPRLPQPLADKIGMAAQNPRPKLLDAAQDEHDFTPFLKASKDFSVISKPDGSISFINESFLEILQLSALEQKNLTLLKLFHEQDRPEIRSAIQKAAQNAAHMDVPAMHFKARLPISAGQDRWIDWQLSEHNGLTYCFGREITDQNANNAAELKASKEQLIEAESIGRFGRWQWTIGHHAFDWSDEIYRIFGLETADFTPEINAVYALLHEDDRDRMDQTFQRAVINQTPFDVDFCITRPDGERRYIRCEGRCRADAQGEIITLYGIMQDMSERILYENELREAKEAAEKACAARTQFLANMSHELRTPLNAIIGFSEIIETQMFGPVGHIKYGEYATHIHESGKHLLDLIGDILDMAKIEAGRYELDTQAVKINDIITSAITMIRPRADEKKLGLLQTSSFRSDMILTLDRRACLQIVLNILSNAVKFTPEGGKITLSCEEHKNSIALTITDTGIGIPATKLVSITNPFEQVSSHYTRDHEGSGLGLAITKELVELHGGSLKIKSQINVGTQVCITLPLS